MMSSVSEDLYQLIGETLGCELAGMRITHEGRVIVELGRRDNCAFTVQIPGNSFKADIFADEKISPTEKEMEHIRKIFRIYSCTQNDSSSRVFCGAEIIDTITSRKAIDDVLHQLVSMLVGRGGFSKAGVMFLNEALLELRGVIYADSSGKIDFTGFKKTRLTFETKNQLSDIMFYDRTDLVNAGSVKELEGMSEYFTGDLLVTGLGVGDRPIGLLIACKDNYDLSDREALLLYGNICSLSIEFSRTVKQLELTAGDLRNLRKTALNAENLVKMGRLSATVAHELKNPLVAIGGFTKRMEQTAVNPQTKNYIKIVQSEVHRLERIVGDILLYSRKVELELTDIKLKELIDEILQLSEGCLSFGMINVEIKIDDSLTVKADRDKLKQVIMNLISNSVQEMTEGGVLKIHSSESEKHATVSVADTGGGIPADKREKIFEPFYTLKKSGTGLGLPLCKKIMAAHGGDVVVGDAEGGAVFSLILPKRG